jgi:glucosyl-dolichyl phosphate glucuronosyltransferase
MIPKISVVVTTYNRPGLLKNCLESLCRQTLDQNLYEIIVVDNFSTEDTRQVVEAFEKTRVVRYFIENKEGMNNARNLGLKEARGNYVAYIDDDALAAPNWLEIAIGEFSTVNPIPDCLGGPIFPFYTSPKPEWFDDKYEIRRDWHSPRYLQVGESFSGSNMIWRKDVLAALKGFDPNLGVTGNTLRLGGETIVFSKIWLANGSPQLYFQPDLIVRHWVPEYKMKVLYRVKRNIAQGQYFAKINQTKKVSFRARRFFKLLVDCGKITVRAILNAGTYPRWQNWIIDQWTEFFASLGELLGILGFQITLTQKNG